MKLRSARDLKAELLSEGVTRRTILASSLPKMAMVTMSALPVQTPPTPFALGIVGKGNNYKLAIRVQNTTPGLESRIEEVSERARGEIDIRHVGRVVKQTPWQQNKNRPLKIGGSIGHYKVTAGTLGCFVKSQSGGEMILSNNHVLANENDAAKGDSILQPGRVDGGYRPDDVVSTLTRFIPLKNRNKVDAAVADIEDDIEYYPDDIQGLSAIAGLRTTPLDEGEIVYKLGRTTGLTKGRVTAIEVADLEIGYGGALGNIFFDEQIEIAPAEDKPFSLGGDSGSLIVDADHKAVGLLFSGNDVDATYANPIDAVFAALKLDLLLK